MQLQITTNPVCDRLISVKLLQMKTGLSYADFPSHHYISIPTNAKYNFIPVVT